MSWAGLASNETISFNNLQNGVDTGQFTAKTSIPVSDEQITKTDANTYVNIDTAYAPYSSKASNQLVVKSDLITTTTTTTAPPSYDYDFDDSGYGTGAQACTNYAGLITLYAAAATGDLVTVFYTDSGLTTPFVGSPPSFYAWVRSGGSGTYRGRVSATGVTSIVSNC
jgi:hypothetical protein